MCIQRDGLFEPIVVRQEVENHPLPLISLCLISPLLPGAVKWNFFTVCKGEAACDYGEEISNIGEEDAGPEIMRVRGPGETIEKR